MKRPFPKFSLLSWVPALLFGVGSYPIWLRIFAEDPTGKAGFFIIFAALTCALLIAGIGAILGAVLAVIAHRRRERFVVIRALGFIGNLALACYAFYVWFSLPHA